MKTHYSNDQIEYWTNAAKLEAQDYPNTSIRMALTVQNDIIDQLLSELSEWQPWADRPDNWRDLAHNGQLEIKCKADYEDHYNGGRALFLPEYFRLPQPPSNEETSA